MIRAGDTSPHPHQEQLTRATGHGIYPVVPTRPRKRNIQDLGGFRCAVMRGALTSPELMREKLICDMQFLTGLSIAASCPHYNAIKAKR